MVIGRKKTVAEQILLAFKKHNRQYLADKMGIDRVSFWRKVKGDSFTPEEVAILKKEGIIS